MSRIPIPRPAGTVLAALLLAGLVPSAALAGPRIQLDHREHDFGSVLQGKIVTHRFPFANAGDEDLVIQEVSTPCGCTAVLAGESVIPPGGTSHIDVDYDSAARSGDVVRIITVLSNDSEEPELTLRVTAHVDASMHQAFKSGETLFGEKCGSCHAAPAQGKTGADLYDAACWFCHGRYREGKTAPALPPYPDTADPFLTEIIQRGRAGTEMPAFAVDQRGPLSEEQIRSLVEWLHTEPPPAPPLEPETSPPPAAAGESVPFFQ